VIEKRTANQLHFLSIVSKTNTHPPCDQENPRTHPCSDVHLPLRHYENENFHIARPKKNDTYHQDSKENVIILLWRRRLSSHHPKPFPPQVRLQSPSPVPHEELWSPNLPDNPWPPCWVRYQRIITSSKPRGSGGQCAAAHADSERCRASILISGPEEHDGKRRRRPCEAGGCDGLIEVDRREAGVDDWMKLE